MSEIKNHFIRNSKYLLIMIIVSFTISKTLIIVCKYIIVLIIFNDRVKSLYYYLLLMSII